ncbi:hypothetical protein EJ110_NYTH57514 [Nymphaea thermarum]|nr:hypothetical protein EJ110_NYTH57514 [Nymphaea thermarum]
MDEKKQHFVLVHGSCHGAWCWFNLAPLLRKAGHEVSVFDLKASGIHPAMPDQVVSVADYSQPLLDLLDSIAADERVVLVGHSFGGFSIALAADKFPAKVSVADYTLATTLVRAAPFYRDDLSKQDFVSEANYGRTKRVYVVCKDDEAIKESFQRWMIEMSPVDEVVEIEGADHMVMLSKPLQLCSHLLNIAQSYD